MNMPIDTAVYKNVDQWIHVNCDIPVKLHLGCGSNYLKGWCNIDAYQPVDSDTHRGTFHIAPDIWSDIMSVPARDNTVDVIMTQHVVEHFYRHQVISLLKEFFRILKPGGTLVTEMPDLSRILMLLRFLPFRPNYPIEMNANRDMILAQLYGASWEANDQGYPYHKYLWKRDEFCLILNQIGYNIVLATGATCSHVPYRDMAIICQKPIDGNSPTILSTNTIEMLKGYGSPLSRFIKQLKSLSRLAIHC